ncbi:MAG: Methionyl-tRNA formyltransferase [Claussenomyces sp. TS43310]|nr:MAG: Methionyl-tRNA formyltransferase [Claussenomyces sp. TS43310]
MKQIREVPIKGVAQELGLRLYERDTFKDWTLPCTDGQLINLIIAVSFGLFIPPRILNSAAYGGINVHPSLLPDFRGAAPLQHTLLADEEHTGVTLQTLDPMKFDHGRILAQESFPIPNASTCTYPDLLELITPKAASLLVRGLQDRAFDPHSTLTRHHFTPPRISNALPTSDEHTNSEAFRRAPKITPEDRQICWPIRSDELLRRDRVLGRLWCLIAWDKEAPKRVVLHGLESVSIPSPLSPGPLPQKTGSEQGVKELPCFGHDDEPVAVPILRQGDELLLLASETDAILVKEITVEGKRKMPAARALAWALGRPSSDYGRGENAKVATAH